MGGAHLRLVSLDAKCAVGRLAVEPGWVVPARVSVGESKPVGGRVRIELSNRTTGMGRKTSRARRESANAEEGPENRISGTAHVEHSERCANSMRGIPESLDSGNRTGY
jgi:hypothetical protein